MKKNKQALREILSAEDAELLLALGDSIYLPELKDRFQGVFEDIVREIRGGMCTVDQGYAYLEHFEMRLRVEQARIEESTPIGA
ncbi:hypothetical protein [Rothia aerolata]|uniref:Uncharacterized protein n=1 Tax=Rothia aerolata TaxID=1812262 RepID=A0A917MSG3_9MICC|nr:hypothetical protein [Rothia aerolata]GGH60875.1 hypothetical protein GCM10007359_09500 [Rothia aerolata]